MVPLTNIISLSSWWVYQVSLKSCVYFWCPLHQSVIRMCWGSPCLRQCSVLLALSGQCLWLQSEGLRSEMSSNDQYFFLPSIILTELWKTDSQRRVKLAISFCSTWSYIILQHITWFSHGIRVLVLMERHSYYKQFQISRCVS